MTTAAEREATRHRRLVHSSRIFELGAELIGVATRADDDALRELGQALIRTADAWQIQHVAWGDQHD